MNKQLTDGHIVITGFANGQHLTLEGDIKDVSLGYESEYLEDYFLDSKLTIKDFSKYTLEFKPNDKGRAYTIKVRDLKRVDRSARIVADDRTAKAVEQARLLVGAPEYARFRYSNIARMDCELIVMEDAPVPVEVEFYWKEEV